MKNAVIVAGARTPIGSFLGSLSSLTAPQLGALAITGALAKSGLTVRDIDEVIMGQVLQGGVGQAPARQASLKASLPNSIPCTTVNKVCGSGLKAVMMAADQITLGQKAIIAGGMESMSNAPYALANARHGLRMGHQPTLDLMIHDGLWDPYSQAPMGSFGDRCAEKYGFTRQDQDQFAHESYQYAIAAQKNRSFVDEIVPVEISQKSGVKNIDVDEEPLRYMPDKFATLKPAFLANGTTTAANASKINDGAAALVVVDEQFARERNLNVKARIIAKATYAHEPEWFTTAPVMAIQKALQYANMKTSDIDLYEINEAFSVVTMAAIKELSLVREQVNVLGGAIALGHPIGASGARLLVTLLNALSIKNKRFGCVSLCLGGGEAVAAIIERL